MKNRNYLTKCMHFLMFIQGAIALSIGAVLPMMSREYGLDYITEGYIISANNIGNMAAGLLAGFLPIYFGLKKSFVALDLITFAGFAVSLFTGNPVILCTAFLLAGFGRGAISNFGNLTISNISHGEASQLNFLHVFFAVGAVSMPLFVQLCTRNSSSGWRTAIMLLIVLGIVSVFLLVMSDMNGVEGDDLPENRFSFGFLKERPFVLSTLIMFCYLAVEAVVMGWLATYYIACSSEGAEAAQFLTSILWITILIGRLLSSRLSEKMSKQNMLLIMAAGSLVFLCILLTAESLVLLIFSTIGLGVFFAGIYATTVANAGDVFSRYPLAMSALITLSGIGSSILPSVVGWISENSGIRKGMWILVIPAFLMLLLSWENKRETGRKG